MARRACPPRTQPTGGAADTHPDRVAFSDVRAGAHASDARAINTATGCTGGGELASAGERPGADSRAGRIHADIWYIIDRYGDSDPRSTDAGCVTRSRTGLSTTGIAVGISAVVTGGARCPRSIHASVRLGRRGSERVFGGAAFTRRAARLVVADVLTTAVRTATCSAGRTRAGAACRAVERPELECAECGPVERSSVECGSVAFGECERARRTDVTLRVEQSALRGFESAAGQSTNSRTATRSR